MMSALMSLNICRGFAAVLALAVGPSYAQLTNQRLYDTIPTMPDFWPKRVALFEAEPVTTGKVIFLGNSITQGGDWQRLFGDTTIINRGIGGDVTYGLLHRLDDIILRKPSKLFILIGINDISKDIPDAVIADNCRQVILRIRSACPSTKIYLQSVLPLNPTVRGFPQHYDKASHVLSTNRLLEQLAANLQVTFVDLYSLFADDQGLLPVSVTGDGLHLNESGYGRWRDYLIEKGYMNR